MIEQLMDKTNSTDFPSDVTTFKESTENVEILDLTLAEPCEVVSGPSLNPDQKVSVARTLDSMGVSRIGVFGCTTTNLPLETAMSQCEIETVKEISRIVKRAKLWSMVNFRDEIDRALDAGLWGVTIRRYLAHNSYIHHEEQVQKIQEIVELGKYARSNGLHVSLMAQDILPPHPGNGKMKGYLCSVQDQFDMDEICLADSNAMGSPYSCQHVVRMVRNWMGIPIQVRCHDYLGMGAANSCAAVSAGASVVHTTINGNGQYSGIPLLEEVGVALELGLGINTGIKIDQLFALSRRVQDYTGNHMPSNKLALRGRAIVLSDEIKYIKHTLEKQKSRLQIIPPNGSGPKNPGNRHRLANMCEVTRTAVENNLKEYGLYFPNDMIEKIYVEVKAASENEQRKITDSEFKEIIKKALVQS